MSQGSQSQQKRRTNAQREADNLDAWTRALDAEARKNQVEADALAAEARLHDAQRAVAELEAHEKGVDFQGWTNRYLFSSSVDPESVDQAVRSLDYWSKKHENERIEILLSSPGGSIFHGLQLIGFLNELKRRGHEVEITAFGWCCSMAGPILQAASEGLRQMDKDCWLMIHEPSHTFFADTYKMHEFKDEAKLLQQLWQHCAELLSERATIPIDEIIKRADRRDWWLRAPEAQSLGFIDTIV